MEPFSPAAVRPEWRRMRVLVRRSLRLCEESTTQEPELGGHCSEDFRLAYFRSRSVRNFAYQNVGKETGCHRDYQQNCQADVDVDTPIVSAQPELIRKRLRVHIGMDTTHTG